MKNISITAKFLTIMMGFGAFSLLVAAYAGSQIWSIDRSYTNLLNGEVAASRALAQADKEFQDARSAIGDLLMSRSDALNASAMQELSRAHAQFQADMDSAMTTLPSDAALAQLRTEGLAILDHDCAQSIAAAKASTSDTEVVASQVVFLQDCQPKFPALSEEISAYSKTLADRMSARNDALTVASEKTIAITLGVIATGLIVVLVGGFATVRGLIVRPVNRLVGVMDRLAQGDLSTAIDDVDRKDEVGTMARAVRVFKDNGLHARQLETEASDMRTQTEDERQRNQESDRRKAAAMAQATDGLASGLRRLANGDLTASLIEPFNEEFEGLRADFNAAVAQLRETLIAVSNASGAIDGGAREIGQSADDLSRRTEQQAASLEETAAALDQITANVTNSSTRAEEARVMAKEANDSATQSGAVVGQAVNAMQRIEQSSVQVSNIIGVIDDIAFQTNLLALNAGVEAARAGEAGKGFAVVAQEVRELAQRSAKAAREIKDLIRQSSEEVHVGVDLVSKTGEALRTIGSYVAAINQHMDAIAISSREQSTGLSEVNTAVNQMDQVTQQNAAMVEESNAASASLVSETRKLSTLIGQFQLQASSSGRDMSFQRSRAA